MSYACMTFLFRLTDQCLQTDVINVSGHRLSTAEIESALIMHKGVAETAGEVFSTIVINSVLTKATFVRYFQSSALRMN